MRRIFAIAAVATVLMSACSSPEMSEERGAGNDSMDAMGKISSQLPAVKGYFDGREISFVHPEASDPDAAQMLTEMMDSPVLVVPSLAEVPESALSRVFVFRNGVKGDGPMGYQPDVFDSAPGAGNYSPLRRVHFVSWVEGHAASILKSVREVQAADAEGKLRIERSSVVVNMPFLEWPGGSRE